MINISISTEQDSDEEDQPRSSLLKEVMNERKSDLILKEMLDMLRMISEKLERLPQTPTSHVGGG